MSDSADCYNCGDGKQAARFFQRWKTGCGSSFKNIFYAEPRAVVLYIAVFTLFIMASFSAQACSIPVYRYSLDNWAAETYTLILFHNEPLSVSDKNGAGRLQELGDDDDFPLDFVTVDVSKKIMEPYASIYNAVEKKKLPLMVLCYPGRLSTRKIAWSTRFDENAVKSLLDSPAMEKIASGILGENAVVWVFMESGNTEKDNAAFQLLESELRELKKSLKLPESFISVAADGGETPEFKITFSVLRLSRADPGEQALINMLIHSEPDLTSPRYISQPQVFPIFGRGRVLYALVGKGINKSNIKRVGAFLVGPCFCQAKEDNPGRQLLISVDWDSRIKNTCQLCDTPVSEVKETFPSFTGSSTYGVTADISKTTCRTASPADSLPSEDSFSRLLFYGVIFTVVLLAAGVVVASIIILRKHG